LWGINVPAKFVAGDFFDFFFIAEDELAVVVADVSGKGVPAALFMAVARTLLRNTGKTGRGPGEIVGRVNDLLADDNPESRMFVTLFLCHFNVRSGRLRYSNAGHEPPLIVRDDGSSEKLGTSTGPICGIFKGMEFGEVEIVLEKGSGLAMFTDGVTEAQAEDEREFGLERLQEVFKANAGGSAQVMCEAVAKAVDDFQHGDRYDDTTIIYLKRSN
jgi:sigma-B regulation protein RsbU (phosphoserine phosphatase)